MDYPSAFSGVCADVLYTMGKASFMQDIVFNGKINPTSYGFPSHTTQIQIITEFYDPPSPRITSTNTIGNLTPKHQFGL